MKGPRKILHLSSVNRFTVTLDDDPLIPKYIENALEMPSHSFNDAECFLRKFRQLRPVGFFVDIHLGAGLPTGIEIVPKIKLAFPLVPLIVMTSDLNEMLLADALQAGADDFIKKPVVASELKARFNARLIAIRKQVQNKVVRFGDIALYPIEGKLTGNGASCTVSPLEVKILYLLMTAQGEVVSKDKLAHEAWLSEVVTANSISKKMFEIRTALKKVSRVLILKAHYKSGFALANSKPSITRR